MADLNFSSFFRFVFPLDLASTIAGGIVGLALVYLVKWLWRPKVKELGFRKEKVNFGTLHKFGFKIKGKEAPGLCSLEIEWCGNKVFAKWDETSNPLKDDKIDEFVPERVPQTYYQPIFLNESITCRLLSLRIEAVKRCLADGGLEKIKGMALTRSSIIIQKLALHSLAMA